MAERERSKSFPPGYRFKPRDHELIKHYLKPKLFNKVLPWNLIREVNLYNFVPEDLAAQHPSYGEGEWYYFTPRDKKYPNGKRPNRAAGNGDGYWKATGADRKVIEENGVEIGSRKALVYYRGKPPKGKKTDWMMHEFVLKDAPGVTHNDNKRLDDWVLCKIYKKAEKHKDYHVQAVPVPETPPAAAAPLVVVTAPQPLAAYHPLTAVAPPIFATIPPPQLAHTTPVGSLPLPAAFDTQLIAASAPPPLAYTIPPLFAAAAANTDEFDPVAPPRAPPLFAAANTEFDRAPPLFAAANTEFDDDDYKLYGRFWDYPIMDLDCSFLDDGPHVDDTNLTPQDPSPPSTSQDSPTSPPSAQ